MATPGEADAAAHGAVEEEANGGWALPDWETYSEASTSSFRGDWSDVEADVSLDTASSSVVSTEHQRVYRLQRQHQRQHPPHQCDLKDMHSLYSQRRRDTAAAASAPSSGNMSHNAAWFQPTACSSPSPSRAGSRPLSPIAATSERREEQATAQKELLAQQSEISAELHAVRQQLSDFQDKWKQSVARPSSGHHEAKTSNDTSTGASSQSRPAAGVCTSPCGASQAVQTDEDGQDAAVSHWTRLLVHKLDALASRYSHAPSQAFHAATTHLSGLQESEKQSAEPGEGSACSWHVGHNVQPRVSVQVSTRFLELERSLAGLQTAVETHERRQLELFDRAVRQVQGHHHDKLQRVVDEALSELKLVRGRHKKKEAQWERELRAAIKDADASKQRVAELEHADKLRQEAVDGHMQALRTDKQREAQRYAEDVERLRDELRTARSARLTGGRHDGEDEDAARQAKHEVGRLETRCQELETQQQQAKELHERELRVLQASIHELREAARARETQVASERHSFVQTLESLRPTRQQLLTDQVARLERRHTEEVVAVRAELEQRLMQLTAQLDAKNASQPSEKATETAEDTASGAIQATGDPNQPRTQVQELNRRCSALEKLLADAKLEDKPSFAALSSPVEREGGHSVRDLGSSRSSNSSAASDSDNKSKGKALSLRVAVEDSTLATDEATLWCDSASLTSIDTMDELGSLASQRTTPQHGVPELLALARKLQQAARGRGDREPDPEIRAERLHTKQKKHAGHQQHPGGTAPVRPAASVFDDLLTG